MKAFGIMATASVKEGKDLEIESQHLERKEQFHRRSLERVREHRRSLFRRLLGLEASEKAHVDELSQAQEHRRRLAEQFRETFGKPSDAIRMERVSNREDPNDVIEAARAAGKLALLARRSQDQTVLKRLAASRLDADTRMALAENKEMREEGWATLFRHTDPIDRIEMINRVDMPESAEWKLAEDPSVEVRKALAMSSSVGAILVHLASANEASIRIAAATNTCTPPDSLANALHDDDPLVRTSAFANPCTPVHDKVASMEMVDVTAKLRLIESSRRIPSSIESRLEADPDPFVRKAIENRKASAGEQGVTIGAA